MAKTGLEKRSGSQSRATALDPKSPTSRTRLLVWIPLIALVLGAAYFLYPRYETHEAQDFANDVNRLIDSKLADPSKKIDKVSDDVATMKGQLQILAPLIQELIARKISQSVTLPEKEFLSSLPELRDAVRTGTQLRINVDPSLVGKSATRAIEVSNKHPEVWTAATELLGYRSMLTASEAPTISPDAKPLPLKGSWNMGPLVENNGVAITVTIPPKIVPAESAARYEVIGENLNPGGTGGPASAFLDGHGDASLGIDNFWIKNVIISNSLIVYHGGPLRLENVYFVNCRFDLSPERDGRKLADKLLAAASVTFSSQIG
jgi:hypothetical protein